MLTRSLDDERNRRYLSHTEFARYLGISDQTYRRIRQRDPRVENPTRRAVAERLGLPPNTIAELLPPPSPVYRAAIDRAIADANQNGYYAADPVTGEPTDEIVSFTLRPKAE